MRNDKVLLSYLHPNKVSHCFMESLVGLMEYDRTHGQHLAAKLTIYCGAGALVKCRNDQAEELLNSGYDWLWIVDSDMGFYSNTLENLLACADPENVPVVGGLCYALKQEKYDGRGGWKVREVPTVFMWDGEQEGFVEIPQDHLPESALVSVDATGAACLLIHRSVVEEIQHDWFTPLQYPDGTTISEDLSFCMRVRQLGKNIGVHTGIKITHHKEIWVGQ